MRSVWFVVALSMLLSSPAPAKPADLTKIDRTIRKEPAYKGKPQYCLLVYGPEAKTKVWLGQGFASLAV
jgi:hypothetical protein